MVAKKGHNATDSPKGVVGEIDTSAPFQSVKDAVSLYGEVALSGEKPAIQKAKPHSAERVFAKETQLHLVQKKINESKKQLTNAETTKVQALSELEKAKRTVNDLNLKLKSVTESKDSAIKETESANLRAEQIKEAKNGTRPKSDGVAEKHYIEKTRQQYKTVMSELDAAKQELRKLRRNFDSSLEAKLAAIDQSAREQKAVKSNVEKVGDLSKEILAMQESIRQVKLAALQAQQEHAKIFSKKDVMKQSYKATFDVSTKKLVALKNQFDPEVIRNLETQLAELSNEIADLQRQMENAKASDLYSVNVVTSELDVAKESLQKAAEEESLLHSLLESRKLELEKVKKECNELKKKDAETESIVGNLHVKLRKSKSELEACLAEDFKARGANEEMISTIQQLLAETENARRESEETKNKAEELKKEAEARKILLEDEERKLKDAIEETGKAKIAEVKALRRIKALSERTVAARAMSAESGTKIRISREELESLRRKVEESENLTDLKVAAAMAQVEAVRASENEALKRLETTQKEIEDLNTATKGALRRADMAEAAKKMVEGELRRWHERDEKKASETAPRILTERQRLAPEPSTRQYQIHMQNPTETLEARKLENEKSLSSKKVHLPKIGIGGIFHRRKSQIEGGSPSYLPGEKPM